MKLISIDFEYNQPNEKHMGLVCVAWRVNADEEHTLWLHNHPENKAKLVEVLNYYKYDSIFVAYAATAEARCFEALGLNALDFQWIDLHYEFRQILNQDSKHMYGKYVTSEGFGMESRAPRIPDGFLEEDELERILAREKRKAQAEGKSTEKVEANLVNALYHFLDVNVGREVKGSTRDLILQRKPEYNSEEQKQILDYCVSDIKYLMPLYVQMRDTVNYRGKFFDPHKVHKIMLSRGRVAACIAKIESTGIPINYKKFETLAKNRLAVIDTMSYNFNVDVAPVFEQKVGKKPVISFKGYKFSEALWAKFIETLDLKGGKWPISKKTGKYKRDSDTIAKFTHLGPIKEWERFIKAKTALGAYTVDPAEIEKRHNARKKVLQDDLGSDNRIRPFLNAFGTQTARNGHKATTFLYAQSAWLRALVEPKPGCAVVESDYSSQEVLIGGVLAKDEKLIEAYRLNDPYVAFGFEIGYIPEECKTWEMSRIKTEYKQQRKLLKVVVLGLSYGMKAKSLAAKMSIELGRDVDISEAQKYIDLHEKVYKQYYAWRERIYRENIRRQPTTLVNGWYLGCDNRSKLSVQNFPVQGTGSAMLHRALELVLQEGVVVNGPVHDAIIYECKIEDIEKTQALVERCMLQASKEVLGVDGMRVGHEEVLHGQDWVTEKGEYLYERMKKYLYEEVSTDEITDNLLKNLSYS